MEKEYKGILNEISESTTAPTTGHYKNLTIKDLEKIIKELGPIKPPTKMWCGVGALLSLSDEDFKKCYPFYGVKIMASSDGVRKLEARIKQLGLS